jgi:hypothetical protein
VSTLQLSKYSAAAHLEIADVCINADFQEMPGLWVTSRQGARLWNVSRDFCVRLLELLVAGRFLVRSGQLYRLP